jgi:hypothetical protein
VDPRRREGDVRGRPFIHRYIYSYRYQDEEEGQDGGQGTKDDLIPGASLKGKHGQRQTSQAWKYFTKEYQVEGKGFWVKCCMC